MSDKKFPDITVVDENDENPQAMQLFDAFAADKILRISRVFVVNSKGEMLLQKRGPDVLDPNLWTESAGGHVDFGDSYEDAARRELEEETGIVDVELELLGKFFNVKYDVTENKVRSRRFSQTYLARYDGEYMIDPEEVSDLKWVPIRELEVEIVKSPENFTAGLLLYFQVYKNKLVDI